MSTTKPGVAWSAEIKPTDINMVTCTVSGTPTAYGSDPLGEGKYKVSLDAAQVNCPGPIIFKEGTTVHLTVDISPC